MSQFRQICRANGLKKLWRDANGLLRPYHAPINSALAIDDISTASPISTRNRSPLPAPCTLESCTQKRGKANRAARAWMRRGYSCVPGRIPTLSDRGPVLTYRGAQAGAAIELWSQHIARYRLVRANETNKIVRSSHAV